MRINPRIIVLICFLWCIQYADAQIVINELMAKNDSYITDDAGEHNDWIEIYNGGTSPVNLANYVIKNEDDDWVIPSTDATATTVPAGGFLLLWADKDPEQGADHLDFKLSASGDLVLLYMPDGTTLVDQVDFGVQNSNLSYGRVLDGAATFQVFTGPTPKASNNNSGGPTFDAVIERTIDKSSDDAEEPVDVTYLTLTDGVLQIVNDWSGDQTVGLRFTDIDIPQEAIIKNAYIQFTTGFPAISVGASNLIIRAQDSGDTFTFESNTNNISDRPRTTELVNWQPEEWNLLNEAGPKQQTPNLKDVIQEVIDRSDWESNNALAFIFTGTGIRSPFSYDGSPEKAPRLYIEVGLPTPSDPVANLFINEIAPSGTTHRDEFDETDDWIEIYNANNSPVNIGGLYLSDTYNNLTKWQISASQIIPANGFVKIWADKDIEQGGLHADFNLEGSGERLALTQILGNEIIVLDSITFPKVTIKNTYGRETDGSPNWITFGQITPGASNNGALKGLDPPTISLANGIYSGTETITLSHPDNGVTIRYTTNGAEPSNSSPSYSSPININTSTSLRAKAYRVGHVVSQSSAGSFLFGVEENLPTLVINTDPDNFFDNEEGIYVEGTNGIYGFCSSEPANWNQDWERPIKLSMFNTDGSEAFSVNAGVKIGGGCSRTYGQKSLNIYLRRNTYGDNAIDYPLFGGRDSDKYERIKLRNSGQDYLRTLYRDGLVQTLLWDKVDIDLQAYQPAVLYLNEDFWGIYNIREIFSDEYFKRVHDVDKEDLDLIKNPMLDWMEVKVGVVDEYETLFNFIENNSLSGSTNYNTVSDQIDINEFLNYWISSIYIAKHDWPANNIIVWKERKANSKWRWGAMDHDGSTDNGFSSETVPSYNTLEVVTDDDSQAWPNHKNSTLFFRKLLDNENFRNEYIQRTCSFMGLIYNEDRAIGIADSLKALIEPEIQNQLDKWGDENSGGGNIFAWEGWTERMSDFFKERPDFMHTFLKDKFNLNNTYDLTLNYNANSGGRVVVNTNLMETPFNFKNEYFKNIPLRVTAVAKPGFEFSHWEETGETNEVIDFVGVTDATLTPIFTDLMVSTEEVKESVLFKLFPNPNTGSFTILFDEAYSSPVQVSIYDVLGKVVFTTTQQSIQRTIPIDLGKPQTGVYWISVETEKGRAVSKLVIEP